MDELEELRRLLFSREQRQLHELRARVEEPETRAHDVSEVLPVAVRFSREHGEELSRALQPAVEGSIRETVERRPEVFIDVLHPIIGRLVRRTIAESFRSLLQALNQSLEHTFSLQGLKWRWEAMRTGRSFAEVVLLRSLVYRVEQVFLIHRETSLCLLHVAAAPGLVQDSDLVAGMLGAIQDFARDSFRGAGDAALEEFRVGDLDVWIAPGPHAYLAAVIRGNPPLHLHVTLDETVGTVHTLMGSALARFSGDTAAFEPLRPDLEACLSAQYKGADGQSSHYAKAVLALGVVAALAIFGSVLAVRSVQHRERQWQAFVAWLNGQPGLVVTSAEKHWFGHSRIAVLRDPLALGETAWAAQARQTGAAPVDFAAKPFLALDDLSVRRRIAARFGEPPGSQLSFAGGVAEISGPVPYEWLERFRREATQVPGVSSAVERGVQVTYDPTLVLRRFAAAFPPPATVTAKLHDGTLLLSGTAPYEWITPVRAGAARLPGIAALSEKDLQVSIEPALVLKRFEEHFGLPETVNAGVRDDVLVLSGEASHRWIERVRQGLKRGTADLPGIASLEAAKLVDLDQVAFRQSKSIIESASVYFLQGKDKFATDGFAALSRLPEEIRRAQAAAKRIGLDFRVEIRGYSDAVGTHDKNLDLSSRRAQAVQEFLLSCGLDASILTTAGLGEAAEADSTVKPAAEAADRRVSLRVVTQPAATAP